MLSKHQRELRTQSKPENRWVLWANGPLRGPAVRFWTVLVSAVLVALALGSLSLSPLRRIEWILLALGLTQIHVSAALLALVDTSAGNAYHADQVYSQAFTDFDLLVGEAELLPERSTDILLVVRPAHKGQINGMLRIALPRSEVRIPVTGVVLRN